MYVWHEPKKKNSIIVCVGNGSYGWVPLEEVGVRLVMTKLLKGPEAPVEIWRVIAAQP